MSAGEISFSLDSARDDSFQLAPSRGHADGVPQSDSEGRGGGSVTVTGRTAGAGLQTGRPKACLLVLVVGCTLACLRVCGRFSARQLECRALDASAAPTHDSSDTGAVVRAWSRLSRFKLSSVNGHGSSRYRDHDWCPSHHHPIQVVMTRDVPSPGPAFE